MLYMSCPTCGYLLSQHLYKFENDKKKIVDSENLSRDEKEKEIAKVINNIKLRRYCCKSRLITYIDPIDILIK